MFIFFNTHVDQTSLADKNSCFPALMSNMCCSIVNIFKACYCCTITLITKTAYLKVENLAPTTSRFSPVRFCAPRSVNDNALRSKLERLSLLIFQASLIFASKAIFFQRGATNRCNNRKYQTSLKNLRGANELAYFGRRSEDEEKKFNDMNSQVSVHYLAPLQKEPTSGTKTR